MTMYESLFGDLVDPVRDLTGIDLGFWDTGGGCTALQADLDEDTTVVVTDSPSSPNGQEAHISSVLRRRELGGVGFMVGVYRDGDQVLVLDAPAAGIAELPELVHRAVLIVAFARLTQNTAL